MSTNLNMTRIILCILFLVFSSTFVNSERLHERIYSKISGAAACFRRLNGTHQTGCSSADSGSVGVVQMIRDVSDAQWVVFNATADMYIAVVSTSKFQSVIELFLEYPEHVGGVLIYDNTTDSASSFSQESRCPNEYSTAIGSTCSSSAPSGAGNFVWNEKGTGLLRRDIPFPMFYLPESQAEKIIQIEQCFERFNLDRDSHENRPLCAIQLTSFMFAAVNSEVCLRRSEAGFLKVTKVCDPLGGRNVYYSLFPRGIKEERNQSVTLVTARIDTASLFDGVSPGAASSVVGMVTLISAAATLAKMIPAADASLYDHNVLFTLFNGEAFDYIGSQRVAFDVGRGEWPAGAPLAAARVALHVELGQLGGALPAHAQTRAWPLYAFAPYTNDTLPTQVSEFLANMTENAALYNMNITPELTKNLPPSSLHSFRRILKNIELPAVLIVDHQQAFTNPFYHSVLDGYDNIKFVFRNISIDSNGTFVPTSELLQNGTMNETDTQVKISQMATALARTLYRRVTGANYTGNEAASAHLVDEMLYCFVSSQACRLLAAAEFGAGTPEPAEAPAAPLYVGVTRWPSTAPVLAGHLLALLASSARPLDRDACQALQDPGYVQYWLRGWNHSGICIQTTMNFSSAISPAFLISDYDMSSGEFSTWTESVWHSMQARVFVRASGGGARAAGLAAAFSAALAAAVAFWLRRHAHTLFPPTDVPTLPASATQGLMGTVNC